MFSILAPIVETIGTVRRLIAILRKGDNCHVHVWWITWMIFIWGYGIIFIAARDACYHDACSRTWHVLTWTRFAMGSILFVHYVFLFVVWRIRSRVYYKNHQTQLNHGVANVVGEENQIGSTQLPVVRTSEL